MIDDMYGEPFDIGSRVGWNDGWTWFYGEVIGQSQNIKSGDYSVQVQFDAGQFDTTDSRQVVVEWKAAYDVIVCDAKEDEYDVLVTYTIMAHSKFQAYDIVKRWANDQSDKGNYPSNCVCRGVKPKPE